MRALMRAILLGSVIAGLVLTLSAQTESPEVNAPAASSPEHSLVVTFASGKLTIAAEKSSLQEILQEVQVRTGAIVEGAAFDNTPVTIQLGPGDPLRVLSSLLYGSPFNYIIVAGSETAGPQKIVLSARNVAPSIAPPPAPVIAQAAPPETIKSEVESKPEDKDLLAQAQPDAAPNKADDGKDKADGSDKDAKDDKDKEASNRDPDKDKDAADKDKEAAAEAVLAQDSVKAQSAAGEEPGLGERLANMPSNIDPAIAKLYPGLFGGNNSSGSSMGSSMSPAGMSGGSQSMPGSRTNTPVPWTNGNSVQLNSAGIPILPGNIPPEMWNLYPKNLMDLIRTGNANPPPVVPVQTPTTVTFWDQTLHVPTGH